MTKWFPTVHTVYMGNKEVPGIQKLREKQRMVLIPVLKKAFLKCSS